MAKSKNNKALLTLGAVGVAALLASGAASKTGSALRIHGVRFTKDCQKVEVIDEDKFYEFIRKGTEEILTKSPDISFFGLADVLMREIVPDCSTFPDPPSSTDIYKLTSQVFNAAAKEVLRIAPNKVIDLIDPDKDNDFAYWISEHYAKYGRRLPKLDSSKTVAFSPDLSEYIEGKNFIRDTLRPSVDALIDQGFDVENVIEFLLDRPTFLVQVGNSGEFFSDLDQSQPKVAEFREYLEKEIEILYK